MKWWQNGKKSKTRCLYMFISSGHFLLDSCAKLRFCIFCKELLVVLKAFVHGDGNLLNNYPELQEAFVWVYFHSNIQEFNRVECWGPLKDASAPFGGIAGGAQEDMRKESPTSNWDMPKPCQENCTCCFPPMSLIPWSQNPSCEETHQSLQQQILYYLRYVSSY